MKKKVLALILMVVLAFGTVGCGNKQEVATDNSPQEAVNEVEEETTASTEKNGDVYILYTSDVHCGIDQGFGYAGLAQIRDNLEAKGYETILVDNGDAIQGEPIGTISSGEDIIDLMNAVKYDVAIPGNHEFDYGMDKFLELAKEKAQFKYISSNFNYKGDLVFEPYTIIEKAGIKIAFVGVTTPCTISSSTPKYFQDDSGNYVYGFMQDESGQGVYDAVQKAVDAARAEGVDFVYAMAHLGSDESAKPWTYEDVISNTNGIDVFLDGHRHDSEQTTIKNKDGEDVLRSAVGTKLNCIGYSHISKDKEIVDTNIWTWMNKDCAVDLLDIENDVNIKVAQAKDKLTEQLNQVVAKTDVALTINEPDKYDENSGEPIRRIRNGETNLGDFCADAYRDQSGAEIAFVNGGGIRANIEKGDITYGDIISVHPYGNLLTVLEVSGQQILDALEWGSRNLPDETGAFIQVSGITYEVDTTIKNPCVSDENGIFVGIKGQRRVKNVKVQDEPIDPAKTYTLAGHNYMLLNEGDGYSMFKDATVVKEGIKLDNQVLIDYIMDTLGGVVGEEYDNPYGQGRITIIE